MKFTIPSAEKVEFDSIDIILEVSNERNGGSEDNSGSGDNSKLFKGKNAGI